MLEDAKHPQTNIETPSDDFAGKLFTTSLLTGNTVTLTDRDTFRQFHSMKNKQKKAKYWIQ